MILETNSNIFEIRIEDDSLLKEYLDYCMYSFNRCLERPDSKVLVVESGFDGHVQMDATVLNNASETASGKMQVHTAAIHAAIIKSLSCAVCTIRSFHGYKPSIHPRQFQPPIPIVADSISQDLPCAPNFMQPICSQMYIDSLERLVLVLISIENMLLSLPSTMIEIINSQEPTTNFIYNLLVVLNDIPFGSHSGLPFVYALESRILSSINCVCQTLRMVPGLLQQQHDKLYTALVQNAFLLEAAVQSCSNWFNNRNNNLSLSEIYAIVTTLKQHIKNSYKSFRDNYRIQLLFEVCGKVAGLNSNEGELMEIVVNDLMQMKELLMAG